LSSLRSDIEGLHFKKQMSGLRPSSFFIAVALGTRDYFMIPFWGMLHTLLKIQAASPQVFLFSKLAEASFARSENKKPTKIRGF
jgi:hypothetical protein